MRGGGPGVPLVTALCVALGAGCSSGGWEPVAGKDAKAYSVIAPVLYQDETHTVGLRILSNGTEALPAGFQVRLEVFQDDDHAVAYCAPIVTVHPTDVASGQIVNVELALPVDLVTPVGTTLHLVATADSLGEIEEAIETNNSLEVTRVVAPERRASLTAEAPFVPQIFRDETNLVTLGVRNEGDETAPAGFQLTLEVYMDASHVTEFCAPIVVTCPGDVLPGETTDVQFPLPVDIGVPVGTWLYLVATIDTLGEVEEHDETDNTIETGGQVQPERMPDLIVEDIALPAHMRRGQTYTVTVRVRNVDTEAATAPFSVQIAEPSVPWSYTWQVDADLVPGAAAFLTAAYSVPSDAATGDRTFTATADTTAAVVERDETNNSLSEASAVATLDLKIQFVEYPPLNIYAGVPFSFSFRVTNAGTLTTPGTQVSVYRFHVDDFFVYPDDIRQTWPSVSVPSLAPGASMDFDQTLTSTLGSSAGMGIMVHVDRSNLVAEDDETNNRAGVAYPPW